MFHKISNTYLIDTIHIFKHKKNVSKNANNNHHKLTGLYYRLYYNYTIYKIAHALSESLPHYLFQGSVQPHTYSHTTPNSPTRVACSR